MISGALATPTPGWGQRAARAAGAPGPPDRATGQRRRAGQHAARGGRRSCLDSRYHQPDRRRDATPAAAHRARTTTIAPSTSNAARPAAALRRRRLSSESADGPGRVAGPSLTCRGGLPGARHGSETCRRHRAAPRDAGRPGDRGHGGVEQRAAWRARTQRRPSAQQTDRQRPRTKPSPAPRRRARALGASGLCAGPR